MLQNPMLPVVVRDPMSITSALVLDSDKTVIFRPLQTGDAGLFGRYLEALSDQTRSRFRPHDFTFSVAHSLCEQIQTDSSLRMIAVIGQGEEAQVIAYFILNCEIDEHDRRRFLSHGFELDTGTDCRFAPSVVDGYQDSGVGSLLMPSFMNIACQMGCRRIILLGGVYASNHRAIRFYEKHGFRIVGAFSPGPDKEDSYDMIVSIA